MTVHVALSGGLDSTATLAASEPARWGKNNTRTWSFDYGQSHVKELQSARLIAAHYGVPHRTLNLQGLLHGGALVDEVPLPEGHYTADSMQATVVNGRNLLFLASLIAQANPGDEVWIGVHAGDHAIYPDCRPEFVRAVKEAAQAYDVTVEAPFVNRTKADIVRVAYELDAPLYLTWSCYAGGDRHCGRCGTCVERAEAFHLAGVIDPTDYADTEFWRTQCDVS